MLLIVAEDLVTVDPTMELLVAEVYLKMAPSPKSGIGLLAKKAGFICQ
jgi:hypothetical protein